MIRNANPARRADQEHDWSGDDRDQTAQKVDTVEFVAPNIVSFVRRVSVVSARPWVSERVRRPPATRSRTRCSCATNRTTRDNKCSEMRGCVVQVSVSAWPSRTRTRFGRRVSRGADPTVVRHAQGWLATDPFSTARLERARPVGWLSAPWWSRRRSNARSRAHRARVLNDDRSRTSTPGWRPEPSWEREVARDRTRQACSEGEADYLAKPLPAGNTMTSTAVKLPVLGA
jgi:hypothetical protein